ncbi:MAG: hypothetical protein JJU20_14425 [Opitutales bacterium]|nr:hypothetical protein [Opitutales bacterium]
MPCVVLVEESVIHIRLSGFLSLEDLMSVSKQLRALEDASPISIHRLTDMTDVAGSSLSFETMEDFVATRRHVALKNSIRSAIVAPGLLAYGLARMFQSLNNNPQIEVKLFKVLDEALFWISDSSQGVVEGNSK